MISINDFFKVEMKVGLVTQAEDVAESNKLIRLQVDLGEDEPRTIFTAVRKLGFTTDDFLNKKFLFVTNLQPKKIMDEESQGMILAADAQADGHEKPFFIRAEGMPVGAKVG